MTRGLTNNSNPAQLAHQASYEAQNNTYISYKRGPNGQVKMYSGGGNAAGGASDEQKIDWF